MSESVQPQRPADSARAPQKPLTQVALPLLRHWRIVLGLPIAAAATAAAVALVLPRTYTASTTFVPASGSGQSLPFDVLGLAGQLGLNIQSGGSLPPDFFAAILTSRELLQATLLAQFEDPRPESAGSQKTLLDILQIKGRTQDKRLDSGIRFLADRSSERVDRRTGIVTLSVTGHYPALAAAVANRMVTLLNQFNVERLQSQSGARRRFAEERMKEAEGELRDAEGQHLKFLQSNRHYENSPLLAFEASRLARQVQVRQDVYLTLTREFEEARIAEARDTPLLTTIDLAVPPDRPTAPARKLIVVLGMFAGALTACALAYLDELRRTSTKEDHEEYRALQQAWRAATADLSAVVLRRTRR